MALLREIFGAGAEKVCGRLGVGCWLVGRGGAACFPCVACCCCFTRAAAVSPAHDQPKHTKKTKKNQQVKVETRPWTIELPSRKLEVELTTVSSNWHVELCPGDVGSNDRYVVQEVIKEMARNRPVDVQGAFHGVGR